jgi:uncharacterized membrane protein
MSAAERPDVPTLPFGPMQLLVIASDQERLTGEIYPELRRLTDEGVVRLVDLLLVTKKDGEIQTFQKSDLPPDEAVELGALIGALVGFGAGGEEGAELGLAVGAAELEDGHVLDEDDAWDLGDVIPDEGWAAVALIEHRWAIPLRDATLAAGGRVLADEWIHPADLVAVGAAMTAPQTTAAR